MTREQVVSPDAEQHQAVCRYYELARQVDRGSGRRPDLWSGELRLRPDRFGTFGSFNPTSRALTLTGAMMHGLISETAGERGDALATMLHETMHAMRREQGSGHPAAVWNADATAFDEGLVEYVTRLRLPEYARACGSAGARTTQQAYAGTVPAVGAVLDFAVGREGAGSLAEKLMHESCDMNFHGVATAIVESHLGDAVREPSQRVAAVKAIQGTLRRAPWDESLDNASKGGEIVQHLPGLLIRKLDEIREHHADSRAPFHDRARAPDAAITAMDTGSPDGSETAKLGDAQGVEHASPRQRCGAPSAEFETPISPMYVAFAGQARPKTAAKALSMMRNTRDDVCPPRQHGRDGEDRGR